MFLTKGIISLFGSKSRKIDINNLPDIDSPDDVHNFLNSLKSEIKLWKFEQELRTLVDFLIDLSEKYEVEKYIGSFWVDLLQNNTSSELLQGLLDISLNMSDRNSELFDTADFLQVAWTVLLNTEQPMPKFTIFKIFINLPITGSLPKFLNEKPDRVNTLLESLKEPYDYLRNGKKYSECLLLIGKIGKDNEDVCKLLAFQGIFESLCEIVKEEDDVIAKDAWRLMKMLLGRFNRDYIREVPAVYNAVAGCLLGNQQEAIIEFLIAACSQSGGEPYGPNQKYFSRILGKVLVCAYPLSGSQSLEALRVLQIFLKNHGGEVEHLTSVEYSDVLDLILCYCCYPENFEVNFQVLGSLVESFPGISENFISRVTCVPGFIETPGQKLIFNYLLNKSLDEPSEHLQFLCRVLEILLFTNEQAKQLAIHLPINLNSNNLLTRILQLWNDSMSTNPEVLLHITRVLIVWVHDSLETCSKVSDYIFNIIPTIFKSFSKTGVNESLIFLLLGIVCYQTKSSEIRKLILSQIEYQDFKSKIEYLAQLTEFKKCSASNLTAFHNKFSAALVKVYGSVVQPVIRYFVKGITESAPKEQKDLAKLFEVHEAFTSMQYLRQGSSADSAQLELTVKQLKIELEKKNEEVENLKLEIRRTNLEKNQEVRRSLNVLINVEEKLDLAAFENLSFRRENSTLRAKVERLTEELQIFAGKRMERQSELKLIEIKESLMVNVNENKVLKMMIEKKNQEYDEALEIIGKLKRQKNSECEHSGKVNGFSVEAQGTVFVEACEVKKSLIVEEKIFGSSDKRGDKVFEENDKDSDQQVRKTFKVWNERSFTNPAEVEINEKDDEKYEKRVNEAAESCKEWEEDKSENKKNEKQEFCFQIYKNSEETPDEDPPIGNGELLTQQWFNTPTETEDAIKFFDTINPGAPLNAFFQ